MNSRWIILLYTWFGLLAPTLGQEAKELPAWKGVEHVYGVGISPDGTNAAVDTGGQISLRELASGKTLGVFPKSKFTYHHLHFSADGKRLFGANNNDEIVILDIEARKVIKTLAKSALTLPHLATDPQEKRLAAWSHYRIMIWNLETGKQEMAMDLTEAQRFNRVLLSRDLTRLASSHFVDIDILELPSKTRLGTLEEHRGQVVALAFSSDGARLASASLRRERGSGRSIGQIKLWNTMNTKEIETLPGPFGDVNFLWLHPANKTLIYGEGKLTARQTYRSELFQYDLQNGQAKRIHAVESLLGQTRILTHPDGNLYVIAAQNNTHHIWKWQSVEKRP